MPSRDSSRRSAKPRLARARGPARRQDPRRRADRAETALGPHVQRLLDAAAAIMSSLSMEAALRATADETRRLLDTHVAAVTLAVDPARTAHVLSVSETYGHWLERPDCPERIAFTALGT